MRKPTFKSTIRVLTVFAAFFLSVRKGPSIKLFDILIVIIGFLIVMDPETKNLVKEFITRSRRIIFIFAALIGFIVIAQCLSYARGTMIDAETFKNYGRAIFNVYTLLIAGLIVVYDKKILSALSWAIIASPVLVLPAFWNFDDGVFIGGSRLAGLLQQPLIFGAWIMVVYLLGIAMILSSKKLWQKALLVAWLSVVANFILWSAARAAWIALAVSLLALTLILYRKGSVAKIGLILSAVVITFSIGYSTLPSRVLKIKSLVSDRANNLTASIVSLRPQNVAASVHLQSFSNAPAFIMHHPLGIGFGGSSKNITDVADQPVLANNSYLEVAMHGGIGAFLLFAFFLWEFGRGARNMIRSERSELKIIWLLAGFAFLIDIFFTQAFLWRHLWFVLGIGLGITYRSSDETLANSI
ncbi:MAG: O-antigen ligase family protein, partial [bacterium]|nr:O-antigen ligase family protein [bacterium]